jgi:DNA-binding transcriptional regulator YiaG
MKSPMSSKQIQPNAASNAVDLGLPFVREELPLTVQQAAIYLGVSVQTGIFGWSEGRFPTSA